MVRTPNIDADRLKAEAAQLRDAVAVHAGRAAVMATDLAEQGLEWAAPRAQAALESAIERATPVLNEAAERAQEAADRAKPVIQEARERVVDDYLPRINRAANEAAEAVVSEGDLVERARAARAASARALTTPTPAPRKSRRLFRALGWSAAAAGVAGLGYVLWKRSQPIEDPWAEEYWADLDTDADLPELPVESVDAEVEAAAEETSEDEA